ncbi:trypco2 family protein [Streptomyces sp. NPDC012935]|uniref:trypco2 family protein n=1 Tax=Streptomyces sp. NPDC012935 TaxID=3364857 RepID=UPI0036B0E38E
MVATRHSTEVFCGFGTGIRGITVGNLGLAETIAALREELAEAVAAGSDADFRFSVGQVQLELSLGVTRQAAGSGRAKFWVLELGGDGQYRREEIQRVLVTLEAPTDRTGRPVTVTRDSLAKP